MTSASWLRLRPTSGCRTSNTCIILSTVVKPNNPWTMRIWVWFEHTFQFFGGQVTTTWGLQSDVHKTQTGRTTWVISCQEANLTPQRHKNQVRQRIQTGKPGFCTAYVNYDQSGHEPGLRWLKTPECIQPSETSSAAGNKQHEMSAPTLTRHFINQSRQRYVTIPHCF